VSPSARHLLGTEPEELAGKHLLVDVHPEDHRRVAIGIEAHVRQPGAVWSERYRLQHRDRSWRWIEATSTNLLNEPAVSAVVVNRRDVTTEV
jgi:PAS domain S-box-containing protein